MGTGEFDCVIKPLEGRLLTLESGYFAVDQALDCVLKRYGQLVWYGSGEFASQMLLTYVVTVRRSTDN